MANEYSELEQLVNDVTSLDTARMTLRWALERLNSIEKEKADLKKNLALAEDSSKQMQIKLGTLEESFKGRSKSLGEKENFYTKLEATMSLLGEGKLDIQQLLKKEARLDQLRQGLENEYQDKFEELDRNQRSVIERWNARLLEVESQYAARLSESQKKYDNLRSDLEADYQGRLLTLQKNFGARERELTERINLLETSVKAGERNLEDRKRELETEFLAKKREVDENYRKLKNMLEQGLDEKLRSMDADHGGQVKSLELSWKTERSRLLEEQRVREEQFASAQSRIKEVENLLASQQESHHGELLKIINEKEAAFRAKLEALESEKEAYSRTVTKMQEQIGVKETQWAREREKLNAELGQRIPFSDSSVRERAAVLEKEYAAKKGELDKVVAAVRQEFDGQLKSRLAFERLSQEEEKNRAKDSLLFGEEALKKADEKIKELEAALSVSKSEHNGELMAKLAAGETAFMEKMAQVEAEKKAYNQTIERLTGELRAKEEALLAEKEKFSKQASDKASVYQAQLSEKEGIFDLERMAFDEKISKLRAEFYDKERALVLERENLSNAFSKVSVEANAMVEERVAAIRAQYEERRAALEKEFEAKFADRMKTLESEKARVDEMAAVKEGQLNRAYDKVKALEREMETLKAEHSNEKAGLAKSQEEKLKALAAKFDIERAGYAKESSLKEAALKEQLEAEKKAYNQIIERLRGELRAKEEALLAEKEKFSKQASDKASVYQAQLSEKEGIFDLERMAFDEKISKLRAELSDKERALVLERENLANAFSKVSVETNAMAEERVAAIRAQYEERRAALEKEFEVKFSDRARTLEFEKARAKELAAAAQDKIVEFKKEWEVERNLLISAYGKKLVFMEQELIKEQNSNKEELAAIQANVLRERERMREEIKKCDRYAETADLKIQKLEDALIAGRQDASTVLMDQIASQEEKFKGLLEEHRSRQGALERDYAVKFETSRKEAASRIKQLEEMLSAKENLMAESDKLYSAKQAELDKRRAELNLRLSRINEEMSAQKHVLDEKEKELNEHRLELEKEHAAKMASAEKLKAELTRTILEYKNRPSEGHRP
ncbi:MAG: hypothetical protein NTX59_03820 [Elusimicrobia bacterium]|nr:hypothetical protein [Elusimicrobiota bacterium]